MRCHSPGRTAQHCAPEGRGRTPRRTRRSAR
ncbi:hypothetical protein ACFWOG_35540 [Kitasatospora sp. NPDC058406]